MKKNLITQSNKKFINKIRYKSLQMECIFDIPAEFIIATAIHESNYGKSKNAEINNNLFGITKKTDIDTSTYISTKEFKNNKMNEELRKFRSYNSICDSIIDFSFRLSNKSFYNKGYVLLKKYLQTKDNSILYSAIYEIGKMWATDPNWSEKVIKHIIKNKLHLIRG